MMDNRRINRLVVTNLVISLAFYALAAEAAGKPVARPSAGRPPAASAKPAGEKQRPVLAARPEAANRVLLDKRPAERDGAKKAKTADEPTQQTPAQQRSAGRSAGLAPTVLTGTRARLHQRRLQPPAAASKARMPLPRQQDTVKIPAGVSKSAADAADLSAISADKQLDRDVRLSAIRHMGRQTNQPDTVTEQLADIVHDQSEDPQIRREALLSILKSNRMLPPDSFTRQKE